MDKGLTSVLYGVRSGVEVPPPAERIDSPGFTGKVAGAGQSADFDWLTQGSGSVEA